MNRGARLTSADAQILNAGSTASLTGRRLSVRFRYTGANSSVGLRHRNSAAIFVDMLLYLITIVVLPLASRNVPTVRSGASVSLGKPFHPNN